MMGNKTLSEVKAQWRLLMAQSTGDSPKTMPAITYDVELEKTLFRKLEELEREVEKQSTTNAGKPTKN